MIYHILNGDALAEKFPSEEIPGNIIVIREAFIEGPLSKEFSEDYWEKRMGFVARTYDADSEDYKSQFLSQLAVLDAIKDKDEVFLWFEDDLFCITNMLFTVYYLSEKHVTLYRAFPETDNVSWKGFGFAEKEELARCFEKSISMTGDEIQLARHLWEAYVDNDREKLKALSFSDTNSFRYLSQVIQAHLDRNPVDGTTGRPHQSLIDILNGGATNFYEIYDEFWKKEAIYGFGDVQVYNMLKEMEIEFSGDLMDAG